MTNEGGAFKMSYYASWILEVGEIDIVNRGGVN